MQTRENSEPAAGTPYAPTAVERGVLDALPPCEQAAQYAWQGARYVEDQAAAACPRTHHDDDGYRLEENGYCGEPGQQGDMHRVAQSAMRAAWLSWQGLVEQLDRLNGRPIRGHIGIDPVADARRGPDHDDLTALARAVLDAPPSDAGEEDEQSVAVVVREQKRRDAVHPTLLNGQQFR